MEILPVKALTPLVKTASDLINSVCEPAAKELGLLFADKVRHYRGEQAAKMLSRAKDKLELNSSDNLSISPRVAVKLVDEASLNDDPVLEDMWAGLFVSSCTSDETHDDSALVFVDLLSRVTRLEAIILDYVCRSCAVRCSKQGLVYSGSHLILDAPMLRTITASGELETIDVALDHLREIGLLDGGFSTSFHGDQPALVQPTALGLALFARVQGHRGLARDFYRVSPGMEAQPLRAHRTEPVQVVEGKSPPKKPSRASRNTRQGRAGK